MKVIDGLIVNKKIYPIECVCQFDVIRYQINQSWINWAGDDILSEEVKCI